ncbi:hypothetical protein INT43_000634 [Umbelopsis isabellina]|uniref:DUF7137 domain-containing protein n=1 Tax=Mortierella isabellina TaxID=91625 RepID=A0A8H7Q2P0_MORIS|nr:hypothetical protein INT43_000634 [Umbelopsis isabellina]
MDRYLQFLLLHFAAVNPPQQSSPVASAASSSIAPATSSGGGSVMPTAASSINTAPQSSAGIQPSASGNSLAALPTSATFPASMQPGYLTWSTPTPNSSAPPLYKIGPTTNVTMVWGFGPNLKVRPENLTLAYVAGANTQTITVLDGMATSAVWQLGSVPEATPLMNGLYKILLMDQRGPTPYPSPGWFYPGSTLTVGMYSPQAYANWTATGACPTCMNSAGSSIFTGMGPWLLTLGVAGVSSAVFLYSIV